MKPSVTVRGVIDTKFDEKVADIDKESKVNLSTIFDYDVSMLWLHLL